MHRTDKADGPIQTVMLDDPSILIQGLPAYSPDGTLMAVTLFSQDTAIVNLTSGELEGYVPALPGEPGAARGASFWYPTHPGAMLGGGHLILQAKSSNDILLGKQTHGGRWVDLNDVTALPLAVVDLSPSHDGRWLAAVDRTGTLQLCDLMDLTSGCVERQYGAAGPQHMAWAGEELRFVTRSGNPSPDGTDSGGRSRRLLQKRDAALPPTEDATVWRTDGTAYSLDLEEPIASHRKHTWSRDGSKFAYAVDSELGTVGVVTFDKNGSNNHVFLTDSGAFGAIRTPSFSSCGEMLLGSYSRMDGPFVTLFNVSAGTSTVMMINDTVVVSSASWSPVELCVVMLTPGVQIHCVSEDGSLEFQQSVGWGVSRCAAWSPDGQDIVISKGDGAIEVWEDIRNGPGELRQLVNYADSRVTALKYTPDGLRVVYGLETGQVRSRYAKGSAPDRSMVLRSHTTQVGEMALISGHRNLVAASNIAGGVRIWDMDPTLQAGVADLEGHTSWVYGVAFSPAGGLLASVSKDGSLRVWDRCKTKRQQWDAKVFDDHGSAVLSLAWAQDSSDTRRWAVATGCEDGTVYAHFSAADGVLSTRRMSGHTDRVTFVCWPSMGSEMVSISHDGTIRLWMPMMEPNSSSMVLSADAGPVLAASTHPLGGYLAAGYEDGSVRIWLTIPGLSLSGQAVQEMADHTGAVMSLSYSPDGHMLATASKDGTLRLYQTPAGGYATLDRLITSHSGPVSSLAFAPDSSSVVSGGWDGAVFLHRFAANTSVELEGAQGLVGQVVFSRSGHWVAAATDSTGYDTPRGPLTVWDVADDENIQVHVLEDHGISRVASVAYSLDSRWIAYGTDTHSVRVTQQLSPDMALERIEEILVGDMVLHPGDLLQVGLPSQVLDQAAKLLSSRSPP